MVALVATALLTACGSNGADGQGAASKTAPAEAPTGQAPEGLVTVTGDLGAKTLDHGICGWIQTKEGRVEVWVPEDQGQVFSFLPDDTFEGIRAVDATDPDGVGEVLFGAGQRVTVTGTTYESTPECGEYGVEATRPITTD